MYLCVRVPRRRIDPRGVPAPFELGKNIRAGNEKNLDANTTKNGLFQFGDCLI